MILKLISITDHLKKQFNHHIKSMNKLERLSLIIIQREKIVYMFPSKQLDFRNIFLEFIDIHIRLTIWSLTIP